MLMALTAIWKVLPLATAIGWPVKGPYQVHTSAPSVRSRDSICRKLEPLEVQVSSAVFGMVTAEPADEVDANGAVEVCPLVTYPVPLVICVPSVPSPDRVEVSRTRKPVGFVV